MLGTMLLTNEDPQAAEPHLRRAAELMPHTMAALLNLGSCLTRLQRGREAMAVLELARHIAPNDVKLGVAIGQALLDQKDDGAAEEWFNSVLQADPANAEAICGLAEAARARSLPEAAVPLYEQSLRSAPSFAAYRGLGDAYWELGEIELARATMREMIRLYPDIPEGHTRLGMALSSEGDFQAANESFRSALRIRPHFPVALSQLAFSLGARLPDSERHAIEAALQMPNTKLGMSALHYALAKIEDARDNFAAAEHHFLEANKFEAEDRAARDDTYDIQAIDQYFDDVIEAFTSDRIVRGIKMGHESEQPIFVVGMPRSGTTLIEQILSSHPRVFGAGETSFVQTTFQRLPSEMVPIPTPFECIKKLTPLATRTSAEWYLDRVRRLGGQSADRIVDKMPDNYVLLGWLAMMFPKARLIHCRRDLRDVALSCWISNFATINWSNDIHHIATRIRNYQRLMAHWRSVMPVPVLDLDYEQMVFDQEKQSRRLLDFVGLEWDPKCLDFHQTKRVVQTASVTQVRKPIYTRSVGRWRNYLKTMRPLIEELGLGFD
jgi:tetratricopeptide (TPR) repeat protein